jgi:Streptomyces sporulation and cell division protein, SsgA
MTSHDVITEVVVSDGGMSGQGHTTLLRLGWREADPFAITLSLTAHPDHPALPRGTWVVLRDFLRNGLDVPTGDGEVRIRPRSRVGRVDLRLARDGRPFVISVSAALVADFLDATERVVPAGEEASVGAIEALLDELRHR